MSKISPRGYIVIYGASSALGSGCVKYFKRNKWWVGCIYLQTPKETKETEDDITSQSMSITTTSSTETFQLHSPPSQADVCIQINSNQNVAEQESLILHALEQPLKGKKLDAILCFANSISTGNAEQDLLKTTELMWQKNVCPSLIATTIAISYLKEGGFLCLPGSKIVSEPTPNMVGYGIAKAAIHQLTKSLAGQNSGLPNNCLCVELSPVTLDTIMGTTNMPRGDISAWTPTKYIAKLLHLWTIGVERPKNGCLVEFVTTNFKTHIFYHLDTKAK